MGRSLSDAVAEMHHLPRMKPYRAPWPLRALTALGAFGMGFAGGVAAIAHTLCR
jgi:hypothetical protein